MGSFNKVLSAIKNFLSGPPAKEEKADDSKWSKAMGINEEGRPELFIFALSTCGACRKVKALLAELEVPFGFVDVDLLSEDEMNKALAEIKTYNPAESFPTILVGKQVVVGFLPDDLRSAVLKLQKK